MSFCSRELSFLRELSVYPNLVYLSKESDPEPSSVTAPLLGLRSGPSVGQVTWRL